MTRLGAKRKKALKKKKKSSFLTPGDNERKLGIKCDGPSIINTIQLDTGPVYVTNVIKCRRVDRLTDQHVERDLNPVI